MDDDDPEKRIADLERQLSEMKAAPRPVNTWQQAPPPPPPPGDWQNWSPSPAPPFPSSYTQSPFTPLSFGSSFGRRRTNPMVWLSLVLPIVGLVIAGVVVWTTVSKSPFASSSSSGPQLHTPDGLNEMFASERGQFGDTMGFEVVVYPDYAVLDRVDPQDSRRKKSYTFRNGQWSDWTDRSVSDHDAETDLSKFDIPAVLATMKGAATSFNFTNPDSTYMIIQGGGVGAPDISIYVSDDGLSGHMEVNPDGSIRKTYPPS